MFYQYLGSLGRSRSIYLSQEVGGEVLVDAEGTLLLGRASQADGGGLVLG